MQNRCMVAAHIPPIEDKLLCTVRLFGAFEAKHTGTAVKLRRKTRALLAYLLVTQRPHSRQSLCDLFFAESNDPLGALRWQLSQIRSQLQAQVLEVDDNRVAVNLNAARVDCVEFQQLLVAPLAMQPLESLQRGVALYRGEFLEDVDLPNTPEFGLWLLGVRANYRQCVVRALREISARLVASDRASDAIAYAQQSANIDRLNESAQLQLITLYAQTGQRQAALDQYELCHTYWRSELGSQPPNSLQALYAALRSGQSVAQFTPQPTAISSRTVLLKRPTESVEIAHNLPAVTTPFWGRENELAELMQLLTSGEHRLINIVGPGGMGKTRLALQLARQLLHDRAGDFGNGIFFVALADLPAGALLAPALAQAIGFKFSGGQEPTAQLLAFLDAKRMLLILDNFEHLVTSAPLLTRMLQAASGIRLLVTSRTRLNLYEESTFDLLGLDLPIHEDYEGEVRIDDFAALQLFVGRARRVKHTFVPEPERRAIVQICHLLEGMPLAIELAAGWVRNYSCVKIATEIERNLDLLTSDLQNLPERHRSMRAVFEHSWKLLSPAERGIFARLSIFQGTFSASAAQHVAGVTRHSLQSLLDQSMLQVVAGERYHIHPLLRQLGNERLESSNRDFLADLHGRYYAEFLYNCQSHRHTAMEIESIQALDAELENIRASWQWALSTLSASELSAQTLSLLADSVTMLAYYFQWRSRQLEGIQLIQPVNTLLEPLFELLDPQTPWDQASFNHLSVDFQVDVATLQLGEALLRWGVGDFVRAKVCAERAIAIFRRYEQRRELAEALSTYGITLWRTGENEEALRACQESIALARPLAEQATVALALNCIGNIKSNQGQFAESQAVFEECLTLWRQLGATRDCVNSLNGLGSNTIRSGNPTLAKMQYEEAYKLAMRFEENAEHGVSLSNLGSAYYDLKECEQASDYNLRALQLFRRIGNRRWIAASLNLQALIAIDQQHYALAWEHLSEALTTSLAINSRPDALDSLATVGEILAKLDQLDKAATVLMFVIEHPVTRVLSRQRAREILQILQSTTGRTLSEEARAVTSEWLLEPFANQVLRWKLR